MSYPPPNRSSQRILLAAFVLGYFLLAIAGQRLLFTPGTFWSGDTGIKWLQAEVLSRSGFQHIALPYPAEEWDPEGRFFPYRRPFVEHIEGRFYCAYPIVFPALMALSQLAMGSGGAGLIVALGSACLLILAARLGRELFQKDLNDNSPHSSNSREGSDSPSILPLKVMVVLGLACPVLVYSFLLWAHTLAAALFLAGILILLRDFHRPGRFHLWLAPGVLFALATWMRIEGYGFTLATLFALLLVGEGGWRRRMMRCTLFLAGFGLGLLPVAIFQWYLYGHPMGPHAAGVLSQWDRVRHHAIDAYIGAPDSRLHRLSMVDYFFFRSTNFMRFSAQTAAVFLLFIISILFKRLRARHLWMTIVLWLLVFVMLRVGWEVVSSYNRYVSGLFMVMPYSILALAYLPCLRKKAGCDQRIRWLLGLVLIYFFLAAFVNVGKKGGLQWGPRYLMPTFAILVVLVFRALEDRPFLKGRWPRTAVVVLILFGPFFQVVGLVNIHSDLSVYAGTQQALRSMDSEVIVGYRQRWLTQMTAPLFFEKQLYYADSAESLRDFLSAEKPFGNSELIVLFDEKSEDKQQWPAARARVIDLPGRFAALQLTDSFAE